MDFINFRIKVLLFLHGIILLKNLKIQLGTDLKIILFVPSK